MENIRVKLSTGHVGELRELSARDQMNADISVDDMSEISYYRVAAALVQFDERVFPPAQAKLELEARIDLLTGQDMDELASAYTKSFKVNSDGFELRELKAREQMFADRVAKQVPAKLMYYRVALALDRIGDKVFGPLTAPIDIDRIKELDSRIDQLTGPQVDALGELYVERFTPNAEILKNELSAPSPVSSTESSASA